MFAVDQDEGEKANWHDEVAKIADVPRRPSLVTCRPFQKRAVTMIDSAEQSHWRSRFAWRVLHKGSAREPPMGPLR
jgi:hypothetical protein